MFDHEIGRHTIKAIIKYQERASFWADYSRQSIERELIDAAIWSQNESAELYATARKLMNIEGNENA